MIPKEEILEDFVKSKKRLGIVRTREEQKKFKEEIEEVAKKIAVLLNGLTVEQQILTQQLAQCYVEIENSNSEVKIKEKLRTYKNILFSDLCTQS